MANFQQAIKWLEEGKGIKKTNWRIDGEVHLVLIKGVVCDCYNNSYKFSYDDIISKNWIIFKFGLQDNDGGKGK